MKIHNIWTLIIAGFLMLIFMMLFFGSTIAVQNSNMYLKNQIEDSRLQYDFGKTIKEK